MAISSFKQAPHSPFLASLTRIQAGNTLFKIWDGPLKRHSKFFKEVGPHGADDEDPVVLDGVSGSDFEKLLWILYPPWVLQILPWFFLLTAAQSHWPVQGTKRR